jgi:hypothetical protein
MQGRAANRHAGRPIGWLLLILLPLFAVLQARPALADKRVALVIGNSAYRNVARLDNPRNDAQLLADTLRSLGFTLIGGGAQLDLDKAAFDRTVQAFGAQLAGADVGLFYYAGHGVQVRGENYLIPVDANPTKEADVDFQMLDTNLVLRQMEGAGTRLNIVILDACRNNPFGGRGLVVGRAQDASTVRLRDTSSGLAQMQAPEGTLISFATQPGSVAQDGASGNSPYADALARQMRRPGLDIFQTFNQVGLMVKRETGGVQLPWVSTSPIDGSFYFVAPPENGAPAGVADGQPAAAPASRLREPASDQSGKPSTPAASATVALAPPSPASTGPDVRRFDGLWVVAFTCEATPSGLPQVRSRFVGKAANGQLHAEIGTEGAPGWTVYDGVIDPDGTFTIKAQALTGDTTTDPFHRPTGTRIGFQFVGVLEGASGTATRPDRDCDVKLTKQVPPPPAVKPTASLEPPPAAAPPAAASPAALPDVPQAGGFLTEQDLQRVHAIAAQDHLVIMPSFNIERPDPKLPAGLRKFVGVWASEIGFNGGKSRHAMLIITKVDASSHATGY